MHALSNYNGAMGRKPREVISTLLALVQLLCVGLPGKGPGARLGDIATTYVVNEAVRPCTLTTSTASKLSPVTIKLWAIIGEEFGPTSHPFCRQKPFSLEPHSGSFAPVSGNPRSPPPA